MGMVGVLALGVLALLLLNLYLQSEAVQARIRKAATSALGAPVDICGTYFTPWGGLVVQGLGVPDPAVEGRRILEARHLRIHFALLPMLGGRLVLRNVELVQPVLIASQREDRSWVVVVPPPPDRRIAVPVEPTPRDAGTKPASFQLEVENIGIREAKVLFVDRAGRTLLRAEKIEGEAKVLPDRKSFGQFRIGRLVLMDQLRIRKMSGPFSWDGQVLEMPRVEGSLSGGQIVASYRLETGKDPGFQLRGELANVSLPKLLEDMGRSADGAAGSLRGQWDLHGNPRHSESWLGRGEFELEHARLIPVDFLVQVGRMFSIGELQELNLSEARLDLAVRDSRVWIENLRLRSENLILQGTGSVEFGGNLAMDSALLVNRHLQKQLRPVMGPNFVDAGEEGYKQLNFRVFNTLANPQTDLLDKLVGGKVGREVGQFLRQILGPPSPRPKPAAEE